MGNSNCVATCRSCRFYTPQGRRGGQCNRLDVAVMGQWQSCALALPPFAPSWEPPDVSTVLQRYIAPLQEPLLPGAVLQSLETDRRYSETPEVSSIA